MITIKHDGAYSYVYRPPTQAECNRFIGNGYTPPDLMSERNATIYRYARCEEPPNYPVPAIRYNAGMIDITNANGDRETTIFATFFDCGNDQWQIIL